MRRGHVDPASEFGAGDTMISVVTLALAGFHGAYAFLLIRYGEALWSLPTYDTAKAMPGGVYIWIFFAILSATLLFTGWASKREVIAGAGATVSAVWLVFFALTFGMDAMDDPTPVALPGIAIYGSVAFIAAARAGVALVRI